MLFGMWVGLSARVSGEDVRALLTAWFPAVPIATYEDALVSSSKAPTPIVLSIEHRSQVVDSPTLIVFEWFPGDQDDGIEVGIVLARRLAEAFECRAICDGTGRGDDPSPFWAIVWDRGVAFLADDCDSAFAADGNVGSVRIVRALALPDLELNERAELRRRLDAPTGRTRSSS